MESLECPVCGNEIPLTSSPKKNDTIICPTCDESLWVTSESPLRMQRVMTKWDEEDDEADDWEWESRRSNRPLRNSKAYYRDDFDDADFAMPQNRQGKNGRKKH